MFTLPNLPSHMRTSQGHISGRIRWLVETYERGNQAAFARRIGMSAAGLSRIVNGGEPSAETTRNILEALPRVRAEWLLYGEGEPELDTKGRPVVRLRLDTDDASAAETMLEYYEGMVRQINGHGAPPEEVALRKRDLVEGLKRLHSAAGPVPSWVYELERRIATGEL